jgi:hypothetical protein
MKRIVLFLSCALLVAPLAPMAQTTYSPNQTDTQYSPAPTQNRVPAIGIYPPKVPPPVPPLSRIAIVGGFSPLGARVQVATNLNSFLDLRASGNYFDYSTNFTVDGISANARAALSSAGASLDVYPFHNGFRVSGGALFYNQNRLTATAAVPSGTSFKLNGDTFYSATANATTGATPISGNAYLSLHAIRPAFTVTAGWGNIIPRDGGHWSFPHEIGVAVIGAPTVDVNLGGFVCLDQTQAYCYNFATAPEAAPARADLQTQVAKWTKDLAPLKVYPIISFGIAYNFRIR